MGAFTQRRSSLMESVALLVLCTLFVGLAVASVATGVNAYNGTVALADQTNTHRTALAYISNQVRAGDRGATLGGVALARLFDGDALMIREIAWGLDGQAYEYRTYIYCYGGFLRELYTEAGLEPDLGPEAGLELIEMDTLSVSQTSDTLIQVTVRRGPAEGSLLLNLECGIQEVGT